MSIGLCVDLTETDCITCGVRYALPTAMYKHQLEKGGYHQCPNGHSQGWSKEGSEIERIRRERDRLKQQMAQKEDELREANENAEKAAKRANKAENAKKKLEKRTAAGTCPCCRRTFSNMSNHMRNKHPEFVADAIEKPKLQVVK